VQTETAQLFLDSKIGAPINGMVRRACSVGTRSWQERKLTMSPMALALADSLSGEDDLDERDLLNRFVEWRDKGTYSCTEECFDIGPTEKGISLGCPLSPLIGGFFLNAHDAAAAKLRLFYVRFMDDILILAPTRWQLRGAVKVVNQILGALSLEKHPDKTFIGRIERGFDFLGYHFSPAGLSVAEKTIENFLVSVR
jgi:hypothetical protein